MVERLCLQRVGEVRERVVGDLISLINYAILVRIPSHLPNMEQNHDETYSVG